MRLKTKKNNRGIARGILFASCIIFHTTAGIWLCGAGCVLCVAEDQGERAFFVWRANNIAAWLLPILAIPLCHTPREV